MQKKKTRIIKDAKKNSKDYKGCRKDQQGLQKMQKGPTRITKDAERTSKDYEGCRKDHQGLQKMQKRPTRIITITPNHMLFWKTTFSRHVTPM